MAETTALAKGPPRHLLVGPREEEGAHSGRTKMERGSLLHVPPFLGLARDLRATDSPGCLQGLEHAPRREDPGRLVGR